MDSNELAGQLHDRLTRGELLSVEEQSLLTAWYAFQDRVEYAALGLVGNETELTAPHIQRDFRESLWKRTQHDEAFAAGLLGEAASLFLNGETDVARLLLRDLVNATIGFEELAVEVEKPSKSLHRMLSIKGNPTMDNLTRIFSVLKEQLHVDFEVRTVQHA